MVAVIGLSLVPGVSAEKIFCNENISLEDFPICKYQSEWNESEKFNEKLIEALGERRFDLIFWNPPFFPKPAKSPGEQAFFAGEDFSVIGEFARELSNHLNVNGKCYLVLTLDVDVSQVMGMFEDVGLQVGRAVTRRWGLSEKIVVLEVSCGSEQLVAR